jgi:hypothetical protein
MPVLPANLRGLALSAALAAPIGSILAAKLERIWLERFLPSLVKSSSSALYVRLAAIDGLSAIWNKKPRLDLPIIEFCIWPGEEDREVNAEEVDRLLRWVPCLTSLSIAGPIKITDQTLKPLEHCFSMREAYLSNLPLEGDFLDFLDGTNLSSLYVVGCKLSDNKLGSLKRFKQLHYLSLAHNNLSAESLIEIRQIESLRRLVLRGNRILARDMSALASMPGLDLVVLDSAALQNEEDLRVLQELVAERQISEFLVIDVKNNRERTLKINLMGMELEQEVSRVGGGIELVTSELDSFDINLFK